MPNWLRVIDTVTGLARTAGRLRATFDPGSTDIAEGTTRGLETRLAGVVVAALKEAFDRDRARMDLERTHAAAELRRQAADRALGQLKLLAIMAIAAWMLSAALAVWLPGMRAGVPRGLLGAGWALSFGALACTFVAFQTISTWGASGKPNTLPASRASAVAPWLLVLALASTGASLLAAL